MGNDDKIQMCSVESYVEDTPYGIVYCIVYFIYRRQLQIMTKKNISNHMIITLDLLGQQDKFHFLNSLSLM